MSRSWPTQPDVRKVDPNGAAVIDSVQAITGGSAPYCRRCGQWTTVHAPVLAGLVDPFPPHQCHTPAPAPEPRDWISLVDRLN